MDLDSVTGIGIGYSVPSDPGVVGVGANVKRLANLVGTVGSVMVIVAIKVHVVTSITLHAGSGPLQIGIVAGRIVCDCI